ncbi:MAG: hypothetical protein HWQ37_17800, partial [Nostoc sp. NMS4]|nr:hypothetical protein [Nostoc sp. NMS4]
GVFTTDAEVAWRGNGVNVTSKSISIDKLEQWRRNYHSSEKFLSHQDVSKFEEKVNLKG